MFDNLFTIKPKSYSKYFTLDQLTRTDTGLSNKPTAADTPKLEKLGKILDTVYEKIGPFKIVSGYRSPAVQQQLKSSGNTQAVKLSYHMTGQAADIMPINQNVKDYFAKITATPEVKNLFGGYAIKTNVIHFDTDTSSRQGVPMFVDKAGAYIRFTAASLKDFMSKNKTAVAGGSILLVGAAAIAYFMLKGKK